MANDTWMKDLFQSIDNMDASKFSSYFTENGSFSFGNAEPVRGRENVKEYVAGFFSAIGGIKHKIETILIDGTHAMCRGTVTYTRKDSSRLTVPFANYYKLKDDLVLENQIYADISALFGS